MDADEKYDLNNSYGWLMATASKQLRQRLNQRFLDSGYNISAEQWAVMVQIWNKEGMSQQEIVDVLTRSKVAVFKLVNGLEKKGFIKKLPNPEDKRSQLIFLTDFGKKIQKDLNMIAKKNLLDVSYLISEEEMNIFRSVLKRLLTNMNI